MKRNRKGILWMTTGLLLVAAALCLTGYNFWQGSRAEQSAAHVAEQMAQLVPQVTGSLPAENGADEEPAAEPEAPIYEQYPDMEMPTVEIDGENYVGMLKIPALDLELPVISEWSDPRLQIAPCRYSGSAYTDDLVIMAHNYRRHFGQLRSLSQGDEVIFTDVDGNVFLYQVASVESLPPTAIEEMTCGEWPLSLFTCTMGGQYRVTIRCEQVETMYG